MRKIREVLRLTHELGCSARAVCAATGVGTTEVGDAELERLLFALAGFQDGATKPLPDWAKVHAELKRRGVTLMTLWEQRRAAGPAARITQKIHSVW